jgi:hypothetical protein
MTGCLLAPGISVTQSGAYEADLSFANSNVRAFYFASVADRSGFSFCYCDDSGVYKSTAYSVNRASGATTFYHDIIANTNASVAGTLSVAGSASIAGALTVGSGVTGLIARPYTSGSWGALYSAGVTPSGTNYAFASCADSTLLNAPIGSIGLRVANGADVVSVTASSVGVSQPLTSSSSITAATLKSTGNTTVAGGLTVSGAATVAGNAVLHAGNYSSYALPRDGSQLFNGVLGTYVSAPGGDSNMGTVTAFGFSRSRTGADQYLKIATLPASSSSTRDHLVISGVFDDTWASWQKNRYEITLSNRNSFSYQYQLFGCAHTGSVIKAYQETDGTVSVWAATLGTSWSTLNLNITHAVGCSIYKDGIAGTPTGTLVFDSSLPDTYKPQLWIGTDGATFKNYGRDVLHSGNYNSYSPTLTGGGASGTWNINVLGYSQGVQAVSDTGIKNTQSAAASANVWTARNVSINPTVDRAVFTGVWSDRAVVGARNAALGAWAPLHVNTVGSGNGGTVVLGYDAYVSGSGGNYPILHTNNYGNYTVPREANGVSVDISNTNLNTLTATGFYRGCNMPGAPDTGWYWVVVQGHDNQKAAANGWACQTIYGYGAGGSWIGKIFHRTMPGGTTWTAWEEILKPSSDITAKRISTSVGGAGSVVLVSASIADNDGFRILAGGTATNAGFVEIATADDGTEPIYVRQYTGAFASGAFANCARTLALLDERGNTRVPGHLYIVHDEAEIESQLHLTNKNRDVYFFLNSAGTGAGLWDLTGGHLLFGTDTAGNFSTYGGITSGGGITANGNIQSNKFAANLTIGTADGGAILGRHTSAAGWACSGLWATNVAGGYGTVDSTTYTLLFGVGDTRLNAPGTSSACRFYVAGNEYANVSKSGLSVTGGISATGKVSLPYLVASGSQTLQIGATSDFGGNFELGIALPSGGTHWPLGIHKAGSSLFTVDNNGNAIAAGKVTSAQVSTGNCYASTSEAGPIYTGTKFGSSYGDGTAVFRAVLDNPTGSASYLFEGFCGGAGGTRTHYVRADGCGYFASDVTIGSGVTGLWLRGYTSGSWAGIYSTNVTPSGSNYSFLTDGATTIINGPGAGVSFRIANAEYGWLSTSGLNLKGSLNAGDIRSQGRVAGLVGGLPDTATTDGTNQLLASDGGSGNAAKIGLVRDGRYGINIGLDSDNVFRVGGWSDGATYRFQADTAGNFTARANITAYSDERVKTNWRGLGENFIDRLAAVKHGVYDRTDADITQVGVSAQSLREVMPEAVLEGQDGQLSVAYGNAALAAVIELAAEVKALRAEIAELKRAA